MLLVTVSDPDAPPGGREMLYRLNHAVLADLFGDRLRVFRPGGAQASSIAGALRGHIDGIDHASIAALIDTIGQEEVSRVFLDGSNFGAAAAAIKHRCPGVQVFSFFHNVEARFFLGSFKARRSPRALAVLVANFIAERAAIRHSDVRIALSERDSEGLRRLYGRAADAIAPMVLADKMPPDAPSATRHGDPYALFVGGAFYANVEGMRWFAQEVAPRIAMPVVVVGRGMEVLANELAGSPKIRLAGAVDDLAPWYRDAAFAIGPIFDGSGMKTKVAEALMFGKRVVGTPEAFSGYSPAVVQSGWQCTDADQFVTALAEASARNLPIFDRSMRALYERFHSSAAGRARMADILSLAN